MRSLYCLFIFLLSSTPLLTQSQFNLSPIFGKIIKHNSALEYDIPSYSYGFEATLGSRVSGAKPWHTRWNRPSIEMSFLHYYLGDKNVLGRVTALVPNLGFYIKEKKNQSLRFHLGMGLAYVSQTFDEITNPTNNAIGSHFNAYINFKLFYEWKIADKIRAFSGAHLSHFSNAKITTPNRGINLAAFFGGIILDLDAPEKTDLLDHDLSLNKRKWGLNIHVGLGLNEYDFPAGPLYKSAIISIGARYATEQFNHLLFGWEYEYLGDEYGFAISTFEEEADAVKAAKRQILFIGDEILFGNLSIRFQLGYYLVNPKTQYINTKFFVNYRFKIPGSNSQLFLGLMTKTHYAKAQYAAIVLGYEI